MNITCDHCESEIDVEKDPKCVVYDPSGHTDVICEYCRELTGLQRCELELKKFRTYRIKRGWRA